MAIASTKSHREHATAKTRGQAARFPHRCDCRKLSASTRSRSVPSGSEFWCTCLL